jgi:hypothetical protein
MPGKLWIGSIILAMQILGKSQGLPAAGLGLPAADPASEAHAKRWHQQRILDLDDEGYAQRASGTLSLRQQARVYHNHQAEEAEDLLHQSQVARGQGVLAVFYGPALGAVAGYELAQTQPGRGQDQVIRGNSSVTVYSGAGAVLGLFTGIGVLVEQRSEARELRAQAAESYNRKLLQDLRLWVVPQQHGAALGAQAKF